MKFNLSLLKDQIAQQISQIPQVAKISPPNSSHTSFDAYHVKVFLIILFLASIGGVAARLRKDLDVTMLEVLSAGLNSGLFGLIVGLLSWRFWGDDYIFFLIGFSVLAGFGGTTLIDFAFQVWKRGFASMFNQAVPKEDSKKKEKDDDED